MPIYEYICNCCGTKFDKIRPFSESDSPIPCKVCNAEDTRRMLSVFNAKTNGKTISGSSGCGTCSGGHCGSCNH